MRDILGREIRVGDIVATHGMRLLLVNVVEVSPFAIKVEHKAEGEKPVEAILTDPKAVVIVHEAEDEPYPVNAPQP